MELHALVEEDLMAVAEHWAGQRRGAVWFERSRVEFERAVRPVVYFEGRLGSETVTQLNLSYTEWLLFEFDLGGGQTPLARFAAQPGVGGARAGRLEQVAQTQRFSQFAILEKRPKSKEVLLLDARTGQRHLVCDSRLLRHKHWRQGLVAERIAQVDGLWLPVGKTLLYDRCPCRVERGGATSRERVVAQGAAAELLACQSPERSFFLDLLAKLFGSDGPWHASARVTSI